MSGDIIFRPKWRAACVEFPALGERVTVPPPQGEGIAKGTTFRQDKVSVTYDRYDRGDGVGSASGHAGNGLWWESPVEVFTIGNVVRMTPIHAEEFAKWILMMIGKPVKEEKSEYSHPLDHHVVLALIMEVA